jgi:hypothetical protein
MSSSPHYDVSVLHLTGHIVWVNRKTLTSRITTSRTPLIMPCVGHLDVPATLSFASSYPFQIHCRETGHINDVKANNATIIMADGSKLSTSTAGMSYRDISGCLGGALRCVQTGRASYVRQSPNRILELLPPPPADMLYGVSKDTGKGDPMSSITDTVAVMLGFMPPPISPGKMSISSSPANAADTKGRKPTPNQDRKPAPVRAVSSTNGDVDRKPSPSEAVGKADGLNNSKDIPMETDKSSSVAVNPKAAKAPVKNEISSPDSDSEESIPEAIAFKSSK